MLSHSLLTEDEMTGDKSGKSEASGTNKEDKYSKVRNRRRWLPVRKRWQDLSLAQKTGNILMAGVELVLTSVALWDIAHRPVGEINGKKRMWVMTSFIQPIGPIIYFLFGRKMGKEPASADLLPASI